MLRIVLVVSSLLISMLCQVSSFLMSIVVGANGTITLFSCRLTLVPSPMACAMFSKATGSHSQVAASSELRV